MQTIYLISGSLGVGKSAVARELAQTSDNIKLVNGDEIFYPYDHTKDITWEKKLELAWADVIVATKIVLDRHSDVVIDFVVETELSWFCKQISDREVKIKYIILIANKDTLKKRLIQRNELSALERSLHLLDQFTADPDNKKYLYDTTHKDVSDIVAHILSSEQFVVEL